MKNFIYLLFIVSFNLFSQNYNLIEKTDKILCSNVPNLKKAERLLNRAEKDDYGFCQNAKMSALSEIKYLRAKILFFQNDFSECFKKLDSEEIWVRQKSSDSLKIICLFKIYGREKIQNLIVKNSNTMVCRESNYLYNKICLNLQEISINFCFYDQNDEINPKRELSIAEIIKETNFYYLLIL